MYGLKPVPFTTTDLIGGSLVGTLGILACLIRRESTRKHVSCRAKLGDHGRQVRRARRDYAALGRLGPRQARSCGPTASPCLRSASPPGAIAAAQRAARPYAGVHGAGERIVRTAAQTAQGECEGPRSFLHVFRQADAPPPDRSCAAVPGRQARLVSYSCSA